MPRRIIFDGRMRRPELREYIETPELRGLVPAYPSFST